METRIERQRALVAEHIGGENEKKWQTVYNTFAQDDRASYDVVPLGANFKGMAGVRQFYEMIAEAVPDFQVEVTSQYDAPGCTVCETVITGTHRGPYLGQPASGNRITISLAAFYIFNEDSTKLLGERIYFDQASVLAQMQTKAAKSA